MTKPDISALGNQLLDGVLRDVEAAQQRRASSLIAIDPGTTESGVVTIDESGKGSCFDEYAN